MNTSVKKGVSQPERLREVTSGSQWKERGARLGAGGNLCASQSKNGDHLSTAFDVLDRSALLRERELLRSGKNPFGVVPMSRGKWWRGVADGSHPAPIRLGPKITAWRVADVRAWLALQAENSAKQSTVKRLSPKSMAALQATATTLGLALDQVRRLDSGQLMLLLTKIDGTTMAFTSPATLEAHLLNLATTAKEAAK